MSVQQTELLKRKSSVGNSEGGAMTGVAISETPKNNLFANISDAERIAGGTQYRKWFLFNNSAADALYQPTLWLSTHPVACDDFLGLGFDSTDDADYGQGNMTAFSAAAVVALISDGTDTRTCTVYGVNGSGDPVSEDIVLTSAAEVLGLVSFASVWGVRVDAVNSNRTVLVKEGAGGTTRGTIGPSKLCCWLWVSPTDKGGGLYLPSLAAQSSYGIWEKISWAALVSGQRPDTSVLAIEEA